MGNEIQIIKLKTGSGNKPARIIEDRGDRLIVEKWDTVYMRWAMPITVLRSEVFDFNPKFKYGRFKNA